MGFAGLPKPEDRADVIAYLNKQSDSPVDLTKEVHLRAADASGLAYRRILEEIGLDYA